MLRLLSPIQDFACRGRLVLQAFELQGWILLIVNLFPRQRGWRNKLYRWGFNRIFGEKVTGMLPFTTLICIHRRFTVAPVTKLTPNLTSSSFEFLSNWNMLLRYLGWFLIQATLSRYYCLTLNEYILSFLESRKPANFVLSSSLKNSFNLINAPCRADKSVLRSMINDWRLKIHSTTGSGTHQADDNQRMSTAMKQACIYLIWLRLFVFIWCLIFGYLGENFASVAKYFPYFMVVRNKRAY